MEIMNTTYNEKNFIDEFNSFLDEFLKKTIHFIYKNHKYLGYF
ncbi:hypothetical protein [Arcobacter sp. CECT 8983]|nr:hypothetical protein [Arcobacter sp. CECT 8983]